jgi:di/tricarboxylate transporter
MHQKANLQLDEEAVELKQLVSDEVEFAEIRLATSSPLAGKTLVETGFRHQFGVNVYAIRRDGRLSRSGLSNLRIQPEDGLLIQATHTQFKFLRGVLHFRSIERLTTDDVQERYELEQCLLRLNIPAASTLAGKSLAESHIGDAFGLSVLGIERKDVTLLSPHPDEELKAEDQLLVQGQPEQLETLRGLRQLVIDREAPVDLTELESPRVGLSGVVLSPQSSLDGQTLRSLHFREKYGLTVLTIWRGGKPIHSELRDLPLRFGDALLLYGSRNKLKVLGSEPDFLVLTEEAQGAPRLNKAPVASLVMAGVLAPVILGWVSIAIAAIVGATVMVLTKCLTMEEAYRDIEWKAVFLIAGMLPLGIAMQQTGTAAFIAGEVVGLIGPAGTVAVVAGLFLLTAMTSQIMPNAAVTVLMAPIAISTAAELGVSALSMTMVIAISASASFLSPVAHPANSLVMGPGGYKFSDFLKVGIPLTMVVLAVTLLVLPIFWPY